ncbi:alpha/beta hydrolase family protein [Herbihabitans rhizosphaerae]|uniref:Alpha/beta hydrolase family protein n=1 Tax=Herbihabitans rhizosphaerae TaxID=1872711 RepID=A0A4Q7L1J0_9PSEU|nr:alpha/beta fold hydrolase [Herbihabitans rhizosphaerae]RZS43379.1 alpha/beta hydrolase family protein [Herbihabitans rhizosphaerae]
MLIPTATEPRLRVIDPPGSVPVKAIVMVLHGGSETGRQRAHRLRLAYLRMLPFGTNLAASTVDDGVAVWLLRYRYRGWNAPHEDPIEDARWALARARERHPGVPVVLVGHSMGGRVALRVAGDEAVAGVCALAPWTPSGEPVDQLAGRTVLIAHGDRDTTTLPADSYAYALRAKEITDSVCRLTVRGEGHALLRKAGVWTALVRSFTKGVLGLEPLDDKITEALRKPSPDGLDVMV